MAFVHSFAGKAEKHVDDFRKEKSMLTEKNKRKN